MNLDFDKKDFDKKILSYYKKNKRVLPWRENPSPYHVWISEIMLQQTRVDTVIPYFNRWMEHFPTILDLSFAKEEDVLKLWEGLGYYSRARNILKCAKVVVESYDSKLPETKSALLTLPGIGPYTAGAISSIAFGKPEVAIDGNFIRVGSRIMAYGGSTKNAAGKKYMESLWRELLDPYEPGHFNQAIMDLGATICLPNGKPLCEKCPVVNFCKAYAFNRPMDFPKKEAKKPRKIEQKTVFLLKEGDFFALEQRENRGLLKGLWQFPMVDGTLTLDDARKWLSHHQFTAIRIKEGPSSKHLFSHIEWHMISYKVQLEPWIIRETEKEGIHWITKKELAHRTLPTAFRPFRKELMLDESSKTMD